MKTVMVFGTFDIVHQGHIALFKQAKKYGDHLVVVVARDHRTKEVKGAVPLFSEKERLNFVKEFRIVDTAVLGHRSNIYHVIQKIQPAVIFLGYDQIAFTEKLAEKIKELGLKTKIVRGKSYKPDYYKTNILKKKVLENI